MKNRIRYTKTNRILHIVFWIFHIKISKNVFIIENNKTCNTYWIYGA